MRIKPLSQRVKYKFNPLAEVVTQIRFVPFEATKEVITHFRDLIDRSEYPISIGEDVSTINLMFGRPGSPPVPQESTQKIHHFLSVDRTWKVTLTNDFVALTCVAYEDWEGFSERAEKILGAARNILGEQLAVRVGLRYRNIIDRDQIGLSGVPWNELLQPIVAAPFSSTELTDGSSQVAEEDVLTHTFQTVFNLDDCRVVLQGGIIFDQDGRRQAYMIDTDFFREDSDTKFQLKQVETAISTLEDLHRNAGAMFRTLIQERLHDALCPESL